MGGETELAKVGEREEGEDASEAARAALQTGGTWRSKTTTTPLDYRFVASLSSESTFSAGAI